MSEMAIEKYACDLAEADGWIVRKLRWTGRRDGMDRFFLKGGRIVLCEFKRPGKEPVGTQLDEIELFRAAGAEVYVCNNPLTILRHLGVPYENS